MSFGSSQIGTAVSAVSFAQSHLRAELFVLALAGLLATCAPPEPDRPNVILVSVDTLRADHLGCYGYERPTSPFLDALAAEGIIFENAFAQSSWTLPSHMSLFTGRYPKNHGVEVPELKLSESIPTLTQTLKDAGYRTFGFVTWAFLEAKYGFGRGFDLYRQFIPPPDKRDVEHAEYTTRADEAVDSILQGLGQGIPGPYFLFVHLFDPHLDYAPPAEHLQAVAPDVSHDLEFGRHEALQPYILPIHREPTPVPAPIRDQATALYDAEIHFTDAQLKRLFDGLAERSMLENTLVVFTSDHGEELDDHGSMEGHGWTLYDEILHVPLIIKLPNQTHAQTRITSIVESIDIAPTILDLLGLPALDSFDGESLRPQFTSSQSEESQSFGSSQRFLSRWSLRTEQHKLIHSRRKSTRLPYDPPAYELYDLIQDPGETQDLFATQTEVARRLRAHLDAWIQLRREDVDPVPLKLDPEHKKRMRALGYIGDIEDE